MAVNDPRGLTGGSFGYPTVPALFSTLDQEAYLRNYYWTCGAVALAACFAVAWLRQSHLGISLRSLRDAPAYAAARGVNPRVTRVVAFGLSGFLAGIAGALYLSFEQSFTTSQMGLTPMSIDVTMLVIGGLGTVTGPLRRHRRRHRDPDGADRLPGVAADHPRRRPAGDRGVHPGRPDRAARPLEQPDLGLGGRGHRLSAIRP